MTLIGREQRSKCYKRDCINYDGFHSVVTKKSNGHFLCNVVRIPSCGRHEHALLRSSTFLSCDLLCTLRRFDKKEIIDILLFF